MAKLVYIRKIVPTTFLHFSYKNDAFCLRDYSAGSNRKPREVRRQCKGCYAEDITKMAHEPGNHLLDAPAVRWEDSDYWHNYIAKLNRQYLSASAPPQPAPEPPPQRQRPEPPPERPEMSLSIRQNGKLLGRLRLFGGHLVWYPEDGSRGLSLSWNPFQELMESCGDPEE